MPAGKFLLTDILTYFLKCTYFIAKKGKKLHLNRKAGIDAQFLLIPRGRILEFLYDFL